MVDGDTIHTDTLDYGTAIVALDNQWGMVERLKIQES